MGTDKEQFKVSQVGDHTEIFCNRCQHLAGVLDFYTTEVSVAKIEENHFCDPLIANLQKDIQVRKTPQEN